MTLCINVSVFALMLEYGDADERSQSNNTLRSLLMGGGRSLVEYVAPRIERPPDYTAAEVLFTTCSFNNLGNADSERVFCELKKKKNTLT